MTRDTMDDQAFAELLDRARSGDEQAFASIYRDVQPRLLRYLKVTVGDLAEDAAADAWYEVARAFQAFEGGQAGFRSWVFTIARNRAVDVVRRDARRPVHLVEDTGELELLAAGAKTGVGHGGDVADDAERAAATERAIALVRTLPPDQAEAVLLRVVADLDTVEVALLMGTSAGNVRVLAHRGLRRLARTLASGTAERGEPVGLLRPGDFASDL